MVKVRNESFKIYEIDTLLTFIERLAYKFNTLPKYIYVQQKDIKYLLENPEYVLQYENLLDIINNSNYLLLDSFSRFYNENSKKFNLSINELLKIWLSTKENEIKELDESIVLILIDNQLKQIEQKITEYEIKEYIKQLKNGKLKDDIKREIEDFRKKNVKNIKDIELLNSLESQKHTKFDQTKTSYVIEINVEDNNISSIFDLIILNEYVPFCSYNNMYKIYKEFIPDPEWNFFVPDSILLKMYSQKEYSKKVEYKDYLNSLIYKNENGNINIEIEVSLLPNNLTKEEVTQRILNILNKDVEVLTEKNVYISGVSFFPNFYINKDVFSDMCMNNRIFSKFLSIDESLRATKNKNVIQIYYKDLGKEDSILSATILSKIYQKGDILVKGRNITLIQNEPYVRLSIKKALNIESINRFMYLFSKLVTLYTDSKDEIIEYYRKYLKNFAKGDKKDVPSTTTKLTLRDQVPDLFIANYSRKCTKEPIIVDNEIEKYKRENYEIMRFPKTEEEGPIHYYACKHDEKGYIYPGLLKNTLENKEKYKYIPCCYKTSHKSRKAYLDYFSEKQKPMKEELTKYIIKSDKILKEDTFGYLPDNINKLLISINDNITYYRKGVTRTNNSLIECIAEVFDEEFKEFEIDDPRISEFLINKRKELANSTYIALSRQENYNLSINEISKNILNYDTYFDPRLYISILEYMYECKIYVFTKTGLLIPNHLENYLQYDGMYEKSILIYEHYGIDADNAKYPQCELIVFSKGRPNVEYYTSNYNILYRPLNEFFNEYNKSYSLNKLNIPYILPEVNIVQQYIDSNGKTRYIKVKLENSKYLYLQTSPIPPLPIHENNNLQDFLKLNDYYTLLDFFENNQIDLYNQYLDKNNILNLQGIFNGTIYISGLVENIKKIEDVDKSRNALMLTNSKSLLKEFNNNKRISRYLLQNFIWKFSKYLHENGINEDLVNSIPNFVNNYIIIDNDYNYNNDKIFSKKFNNDKKLVVSSKELLIRLVYNLKLELQKNIKKIINFHKKEYLENYYYKSTDYKIYPTQVLLEGENSLENWINSNKNKLKYLQNKIDVNSTDPYFIRNKILTNNSINIAQNSINLLESLTISTIWLKDDYNIKKLENNILEDIEPFDLYIYKNKDKIVKKEILGGSKYYKIAGYKTNNIPQYTSLLEL